MHPHASPHVGQESFAVAFDFCSDSAPLSQVLLAGAYQTAYDAVHHLYVCAGGGVAKKFRTPSQS
jgi:hypothetical protein